jgi:hypothetical protein
MLVDGLAGRGEQVTTAIRSASRATGANFDYLLNTAIRESSLDPKAQARTSSARGLYQFIESTWLTMIKEEGPKFGNRVSHGMRRNGQYQQFHPLDGIGQASGGLDRIGEHHPGKVPGIFTGSLNDLYHVAFIRPQADIEPFGGK